MNSQNVYESAFKTSPAIMAVVDRTECIVLANEAFREILAYDLSEYPGLPLKILCHENEYEELSARIMNMLEGDQSLYRSTRRFVSSRSEILWMDIMVTPIRNEDKHVGGVMITALNAVREDGMDSALKRMDSEYKSLFEKEGTAAMVIDKDMNLLRINDLFLSVSGYKRNDFDHGFLFSDYVHPDDVETLKNYHERRLINPESVPSSYPCRLIHKDGKVNEYMLNVSVIPNTCNTMISFRDHFQFPACAPVKSTADQMFRLMAENSSDQVFIADLDVNITYISPSVEKVSGYSQEEFKLLLPVEYFTPESYKKARSKIKRGLEGKFDITQPFLTEYQIVHKDGSLKWIETLVQFVISEYEKPIGITGASRDITERKHAEEAVKSSEAKYRQLTEGLKDAVLVVLPDMTIDYISPVITELSGYEPCEITGLGVEKYFVKPEDYKQAIVLFEEILETKRPSTSYEFLFKTKDRDPFYTELTARPIIKDDKVIMVQCVARDITERKRAEERRKKREKSLSIENLNLRKSIQQSGRFGNIIGRSQAMMDIYDMLLMSGPINLHTVIHGESGTGKELIAQAIHDLSNRAKDKFIPVNCGAIPENIIESEFFGCRKGAFTGATHDREGFLDMADGGTLFLDEIGEIGLNMQVKLLRAIEGGGYTPVGSNKMKTSDVRIVSASNKNLEELVKQGKMRADFYYRISIIRIELPPLRKRREDVPILVDHFLMTCKHNKNVSKLPKDVMNQFMAYDWPGNVRELQNAVNHYVALKRVDFSPVETKTSEKPEEKDPLPEGEPGTLAARIHSFEKRIIQKCLAESGWNKSRVAKNLNIDRKTLSSKIRKFKLDS